MKRAWASAVALALGSAGPGMAQSSEAEIGTPPAKPAGWNAKRTEWGDPDLRGTYPLEAVGRTPMQRPARFGTRKLLTEEEYAEALAAAEELSPATLDQGHAGPLNPP